MQNSRKVFIETLIELAEKDDKIVLITMDVGFSFIERFKEKFPERYFNFGVTEQASTIIASGLALQGFKPYLYSMINFVCMRNYEMVRNAICYHNANVKLIGVQGSEKYKFLGFSHNIEQDEDKRILKHLPRLSCCFPTTPEEVKKVMLESYKLNNPVYTRI